MRAIDAEHYLIRVDLKREKIKSFDQYPFSLPIIQNFSTLELHPKVTFVVGENGSGKSTLLEAIATHWGFNPEGGTKNFKFETHSSHSILHDKITLVKGIKRAKDGFFLRSESFFNLATEIERLDKEGGGPPIINSYGGISLHQQSHGESFFSLMMNRFRGNGFYILDEPEAALSPQRQLAMIVRIHQLVECRSQFLIATHSPILMAYPHANIYHIGEQGMQLTHYKDTEHYRVTKDFLTNPESRIESLLK